MIHNNGFLFLENISLESLVEPKEFWGSLPEEYSGDVLHKITPTYSWFYMRGETPSPLRWKVYNDNHDRVLLCSGIIYNEEKVDGYSEQLLGISSLQEMAAFLNDLPGTYCGLYYRKSDRKIFAFTDRQGLDKLFYVHHQGGRIFCTNLEMLHTVFPSKKVSEQAFTSIVMLTHTMIDTMLEDIRQVNAGCLLESTPKSNNEKEYIVFPEKRPLTVKQADEMLTSAHRSLWKRIGNTVSGNLCLTLSRGKDCRVILRHLLDTNTTFETLSFFRNDENAEPFVCFLLKALDDFRTGTTISRSLNLHTHELQIHNRYVLDNLHRVITINHGSPLHWEFLAAAEEIERLGMLYMTTGFMGDPFAGKNKHKYYFHKPIQTPADYGDMMFVNSIHEDTYIAFRDALSSYGISLLPYDAIRKAWVDQYKISETTSLDTMYIMGLTRTRGIGRVIPTFHQARLFTIPLYPYNDVEIQNAYLALPEKHLYGERAHVRQVSTDSRLNSWPTTRLNVNAKVEERLIPLMQGARKIEYSFLRDRGKVKPQQMEQLLAIYGNPLRNGFAQYNQELPRGLVNALLDLAQKSNNRLLLDLTANLLTAMHLRSHYEKQNNQTNRNDIHVHE